MVNSIDFQQTLEQRWVDCPEGAQQRILVIAALGLATAQNDEIGLRTWIDRAAEFLSVKEIEEVLLQTLLFAGFPRSIEALAVLREVHPHDELNTVTQKPGRAAGESVCQQIYAERFDKLLDAMDRLHPDLTDWMLEDGYGRVLSRPGLSIQDREYAVLVVLMVSGMHRQFRAHLRGCMNLGISRDDILWFTNIFTAIIPSDKEEEFQILMNAI